MVDEVDRRGEWMGRDASNIYTSSDGEDGGVMPLKVQVSESHNA